jgi:hypothetical protein
MNWFSHIAWNMILVESLTFLLPLMVTKSVHTSTANKWLKAILGTRYYKWDHFYSFDSNFRFMLSKHVFVGYLKRNECPKTSKDRICRIDVRKIPQ